MPRIGRVSGAVGQGLGWVLGRSWSQFVGSMGHQLDGSATSWGGWLVVGWSVVVEIVRSVSGITPPKV